MLMIRAKRQKKESCLWRQLTREEELKQAAQESC